MTASPNSKSHRVQSFGDPLLDRLYKDINDDVFSKRLDRPFQWEEVDGTHMMFVYDCTRFVRHKGQTAVHCEVFNPQSNTWERPATSGQAFAPVMWPIKNASVYVPEHRLAQQRRTVNSIVDAHTRAFFEAHPSYNTDTILRKKVLHVELVVQKKWKAKKGRVRGLNARGAVRCWWKNFVDRSVFKTLVSVVGTSTDTRLGWDEYAAFSCLPNLAAIQDNVKRLGVARLCLNRKAMHTWDNATVEELLPTELLDQWGAIQNEPLTVQEALVALVVRSVGFGRKPAQVWSAYTLLKTARPAWKPRELSMLLHAAAALDTRDDFLPCGDSSLSVSACLPHIDTCVRLWRHSDNVSYRHWSTEAQNEWSLMAKDMLSASVACGRFALPTSSHSYKEKWGRLRAFYEKTLLEEATAGVSVPTVSSSRRRAM